MSGQMKEARLRRHARVRRRVSGTPGRPRLCVYRSLKHIEAQIIDDTAGHTVAAVSSLAPDLKKQLDGKNKTNAAQLVGSLLASKAQEKGVTQVVFDRGGYNYHGRVKALAEAARTAGLKF
jgi:large subunit ribosomal protein L18